MRIVQTINNISWQAIYDNLADFCNSENVFGSKVLSCATATTVSTDTDKRKMKESQAGLATGNES